MNYAFIGLGNMASAIIRGMNKEGLLRENKVYGHDSDKQKMQQLGAETGLIATEGNAEAVALADIIVLAVKPQVLDGVLKEIAAQIKTGQLLLSIAAGKPLQWYSQYLPQGTPLVRIMPNINARAGAAASAICGNEFCTEHELSEAEKIFASVGQVYHIEEKLFPAFTAICGSSIAFTFMYIEALASAGVRAGFSKQLALELAIQSVAGCTQLLRSEDTHPMILVDQICSPAGTTIAGVHKVRELGFENTVYQGIAAIMEQDKALGK